ncbi:BREX-1 system adenine-specific DNA-methyltransferase PglX [Sinorhizobium meliloti]|uniref:BREX-1 system adenine-specific DNA-methyltransferase PglX n=1 Tax=Rhizobium meliloti TaxID=382 RepID=UPI000FDB5DEE|nr:BREX-1 system adenine-specific DNA-methyltransferase PglX [Sinorhizobium meliloti]RVO68343.1 BREX-1 system adenine-specific DNA-methyltransferase PglX [Sinorhizobium meliloti]
MDTSKLKKFAPEARRTLMSQVASKLNAVLAEGSAARRENPQAVKELEGQVATHGEEQVIEQVAYIWFNRFSALRFMDANGYSSMGIVTPAEGQTRPEILAEAAAGHIEAEIHAAIRQQVAALLDGRTPSRDPQAEAYRLLLVAACNQWHRAMPFMFEKIADYTELLMPEDLLSADSILAQIREVMTADACKDVEIIGWLYQFYISEKKDEVFAGLKKNKKITAENIPAATQLFTPHWIVRYLVENSLGRLWMLNRPDSKLIERMSYYIKPDRPEVEFLRISSPEEIKVCDPACGSGHMLTYAFDLLYAIYEEEGYDHNEIPAKILANNLYGIEIDDRAGALAAFALVMKAAARLGRRRFLRAEVLPNVCVLQNVRFTDAEIQDIGAIVGKDLFTAELQVTLRQFEQAKSFGSLIVPSLRDPSEVARRVTREHLADDLLLHAAQLGTLSVLRMVEFLSPRYHIVVTNPPYMGRGGMNPRLASWLQAEYPEAKADLMTCFMDRSRSLNIANGYWSMINLPSWMFISSFEKLRVRLLSDNSICSLLHLGRGVFGSDFGSVAFTIRNARPAKNERGIYRRLFKEHVEVRSPEKIRQLFLDHDFGRYQTDQDSLGRIPGEPIAYWLSEAFLTLFADKKPLSDYAMFRAGLQTGDNDRFLRYWHEVSSINFVPRSSSRDEARASGGTWFPHNKGGGFRKWYGNNEYVINWRNDGEEIKEKKSDDLASGRITANNSKCWNQEYYFKDGLTWSSLTSSHFSLRSNGCGFLFDTKGQMLFPADSAKKYEFLGLLNSKVSSSILKAISPTIDFNGGVVARLPVCEAPGAQENSYRLLELSRLDWDAYESSWDFKSPLLLSGEHRAETLEGTYMRLRVHWRDKDLEMQKLEESNNRIFIDAYGLGDELDPVVPLEQITLTSNPVYRYGVKATEEELEGRLRADTMAEFLHYAVGCMFGRYSLDEPGLILANSGETLTDYLARVPNPSFIPDADNVIPVLESEWFADDIVERFRKFLRVTFGEEKLRENLAFIEDALGKDIRRWFTRDFYDYHVRRFKKRPIYWSFSSPKGTFNALIYMHRYRPDTVSLVLNGYLREYRSKLEAERRKQEAVSISANASQSEKTKALKEIQKLGPMIDELDEYERETLFPLATQKIEIDLDDGVKANYPKFGAALKPIKGLADAEEE